MLNFFGDFKYHVETKKSVKEYYATELIPKHDTEIAEDHIVGTYREIKIDLFETQLSRKVKYKDSNGNTSTRLKTVFDGLILELSMNKSFSGITVVKKDSDPRFILNLSFKWNHSDRLGNRSKNRTRTGTRIGTGV